MPSWSETIPLSEPPAEVTLNHVTTVEAERAANYEAAIQASYEQGRIEGEKALSEQLLQQRSDLLELQNGVLAGMKEAIPKVRQDAENQLIALALEVARKLVAALPISSEMVEAAVREALQQAEESAELTVQLNPEDLAMLERANSPALTEGHQGEPIRFEASSEVSRGGCLVQTRFGVIDARRETKLDLLNQALSS